MSKKFITTFLIAVITGLCVNYFSNYLPNTEQQNNAESSKSTTAIFENHITIEGNKVSYYSNITNSDSIDPKEQAKDTKEKHQNPILTPTISATCFETIDDPLNCPL